MPVLDTPVAGFGLRALDVRLGTEADLQMLATDWRNSPFNSLPMLLQVNGI
jgi:hypothetical protein